MICFFVGHRDAGEILFPMLKREVERHIVKLGVTEFVVGQYGAFDRMAARAVLEAKKCRNDVTLTILIPYHPLERKVQVPEGCDRTLYPPGMETVPHRFAIIRANRYMIDHCDYLIAYAKFSGNARRLVDDARKKNVIVTNLGEE